MHSYRSNAPNDEFNFSVQYLNKMGLSMSTWKTERTMVNFIFKLAHSGSELGISSSSATTTTRFGV